MTQNGGGADVSGRVVDDSTFRLLLDLETKKAQRLRYPFAVLCLETDEPNPVPETLAHMAACALRATDCVASRDSHSVVMLLIDAETGNLPVIVDRLTRALLDITWSAGGASYPDCGATVERVMDQAATMQARAKQDGGRRLYVAPPMS
jgi:hypothetical protein